MDKLPAEGVGSKRAIEYDFCQTPSAVINLSAEEVVHNLQMVNFDLCQDVGSPLSQLPCKICDVMQNLWCDAAMFSGSCTCGFDLRLKLNHTVD